MQPPSWASMVKLMDILSNIGSRTRGKLSFVKFTDKISEKAVKNHNIFIVKSRERVFFCKQMLATVANSGWPVLSKI
jgi:hypothetical protein